MAYDLSPLLRQWIGFDKLATSLQNTSDNHTFPPYNIEKSDDNHYRITLALAGFRQQDLDIEQQGTVLRIKGNPEKPQNEQKWLHQGLVIQPFSLSFTLAEHMDVSAASFSNGLLHIDLLHHIPKEVAAQRIEINTQKTLQSK